MIVGFTGTREGMSPLQRATFIDTIVKVQPSQYHHGMCIGSDEESEELVRQYCPQAVIHGHPPTNQKNMSRKSRPGIVHTPAEYMVRNRHIVDSVQLMLATPLTEKEELRSGTWSAIRYAWRKHCAINIIKPA